MKVLTWRSLFTHSFSLNTGDCPSALAQRQCLWQVEHLNEGDIQFRSMAKWNFESLKNNFILSQIWKRWCVDVKLHQRQYLMTAVAIKQWDQRGRTFLLGASKKISWITLNWQGPFGKVIKCEYFYKTGLFCLFYK